MGLKPKTSALRILATDNDDRLTGVWVRRIFFFRAPWRIKITIHSISAISILLIFIFGCGREPIPTEPEESATASRNVDGLILSVELHKLLYDKGELITMTFKVSNERAAPFESICNDGGRIRWDIYRDDELIFTWKKNFATTAAVTIFRLEPGEEKTFVFDGPSGVWDQKDDNHKQVGSGQYIIEFRIQGQPEPYRLRKTFSIK